VKLLTYSSLYPNAAQPRHGIFVEQRLQNLLALGGVESRVIAPVPWFPLQHSMFGKYAQYARVPAEEYRSEVFVKHPRYPIIPKIGMNIAPFLLAASTYPILKAVLRDGYNFNIIDAHYFYPDGVAAVILGQCLGRPVTITARGNDLSLIARYPIPRRLICWAANQAAGLITVCSALKDALVDLGVPQERIRVMRNGVDLNLFRPHDREEARAKLGLDGPTLISVGHLIERKGNHLTIEALAQLPDFKLLIVGDGPEEDCLRRLAVRLGVGDRVSFLGAKDQRELPCYYSAADALVLASSREGWANVLLESMACGTPVVATKIWGTPEVVQAPEAGQLVSERTPEAIACGIRQLMEMYPNREQTRRYAETFSWDETSNAQYELFQQILVNV